MIIYKKGKITVSTIEEADVDDVLRLFSTYNFNCDYETGALRPTNNQFCKIMYDIITGATDVENILVLKKDNKVIGYISMFVEFSRLIIGHIAVEKEEQHQGYGKLLTKLAILLAENDDRDVSSFCAYDNKYLKKLKFKDLDGVHYLYEKRNIKTEGLPELFVSVEEYKQRAEEKQQKELEHFTKTLDWMKSMGMNF